jgi:hypothetical protein
MHCCEVIESSLTTTESIELPSNTPCQNKSHIQNRVPCLSCSEQIVRRRRRHLQVQMRWPWQLRRLHPGESGGRRRHPCDSSGRRRHPCACLGWRTFRARRVSAPTRAGTAPTRAGTAPGSSGRPSPSSLRDYVGWGGLGGDSGGGEAGAWRSEEMRLGMGGAGAWRLGRNL